MQGSGDVKYHLGTEGEFAAEDGATTKVYLAANPSHLEAVNPVLEGIVRAKQDRLDLAGEDFTVLPLLMHGDAAFAGQGVVAETLNLSQLRGYRTGGTIHVVINNQVGFTTSPSASRSSTYSTDVARMIQAPIFHVNGDDPEACVRVAELAYEFRQEFNKDVVIDMVCYRRRGHNEGDDPSMTQPLMYNLIEAKRSVRKLYTESLIGRGDISVEDAEAALRDYQQQLERVFVETKAALKAERRRGGQGRRRTTPAPTPRATPASSRRRPRPPTQTTRSATETAISPGPAQGTSATPSPTRRRASPSTPSSSRCWRSAPRASARAASTGPPASSSPSARCSWRAPRSASPARTAAAAPSCSATPSSSTRTTAQEWTPLLYLGEGQARFWVYDSLLSEFAAMGFEYGYSVERPDALVLWEAQFGDFLNGAQTIIDEFICSSEQKWGQRSSVVLLLPHGYEGQGPDHSSARIERFLQMCAEDNMTVAYPSTPASLLPPAAPPGLRPSASPAHRLHPEVDAAAQGGGEHARGLHRRARFRPVLPDRAGATSGTVDRVLLAAGKVVYDLEAARDKGGDTHDRDRARRAVYPLPGQGDRRRAGQVPRRRVVVVQDEPQNQGAWPFIALNLPAALAEHGDQRPLRVAVAQGVGLAGHRVDQAAPGRAGRAHRGGLRPLTPSLRVLRSLAGGVAERGRWGRRGSRSPTTGALRVRVSSCTSPTEAIEELEARRGDEEVTLAWLAEQLRTFVDLHPEFETPVERLATWLARLDDEDD